MCCTAPWKTTASTRQTFRSVLCQAACSWSPTAFSRLHLACLRIALSQKDFGSPNARHEWLPDAAIRPEAPPVTVELRCTGCCTFDPRQGKHGLYTFFYYYFTVSALFWKLYQLPTVKAICSTTLCPSQYLQVCQLVIIILPPLDVWRCLQSSRMWRQLQPAPRWRAPAGQDHKTPPPNAV